MTLMAACIIRSNNCAFKNYEDQFINYVNEYTPCTRSNELSNSLFILFFILLIATVFFDLKWFNETKLRYA